jgi:hypothetical protein
MLKPLEDMDYHPTSKSIVKVLSKKTQNTDSDVYYHILSAFYFAQMASSMRAEVVTLDRGSLPINIYACNLGVSGMGKGHSMGIMEDEIVGRFKNVFTKYTFPAIAEDAINVEATRNAAINSTEVKDELLELNKEFKSYGAMPYSFDSGTSAAFKQVRTKAQIAQAGSLNFVCDEIGSNIIANQELFAVGLEAYDKGKIKQKIIKNTADNVRSVERDDPVPTNILIFGTPSKVFNGGREEQEYMALLDTGYARRFLFGMGYKGQAKKLTPEQIFDMLTDTSVNTELTAIASKFGALADRINYNQRIKMSREVSILLIAYRLQCEEAADALPEYEEIRKAEMQHRYFKALKLAAAYAFIDSNPNVTEELLYNAIKLTEESGAAFSKVLSRDKPYVKLAKYISSIDKEVTYADLVEDLPFFRGSMPIKNELIQLATAWGYKNNIVIRKYYSDGIEFLKGESLKETSLEAILTSYSNHEAYGYEPAVVPFAQFHKLACRDGLHWCNHSFVGKHRKGENVIEGFNSVIIDVDGEVQLDAAKELLKEYTCMYYSTKRSTDEVNRFRIVMPIQYHLKLNEKDFKEFMSNIFEWLPFGVDVDTGTRSKKWLSNDGYHCYNDGELLDPMQFIPKTTKNEARIKSNADLGSMDNVERWFAREMVNGQRNNTLAKYAFMLLDGGVSPDEAEQRVIDFNSKLKDKLTVNELQATVIKSLWGRAKANGH